MRVLGIDPGLSGGWAFIRIPTPPSDPCGSEIGAAPMPLAGDLYDCARLSTDVVLTHGRPDLVVIERVGAMPKQGLSSTFKFGRGFGQLIGMCQASGWPFILVTPQEWKKHVLKGTPGDKDAAIAFTTSRYPTVQLIQPRCRVPHDGVADAVCLAHYGVHYAR